MIKNNLLIKIFFFYCFIINVVTLNADILETLNTKEQEEKKAVSNVFESECNSFDKLLFGFDDNYKLKYYNKGKIIMYISTDYMNIDINNVFNYIKFDILIDKDKIYECSFSSKKHTCNTDYYTIKAADELTGGLLNVASAIFSEKLSVKKKFDKIEFSKLIIKNKDFLQQFVSRYTMSRINFNPLIHNTEKSNIDKQEVQNKKSKVIEEGW